MRSAPIHIVGGGAAAFDSDGRLVTKASLAAYLNELAGAGVEVHWWAHRAPGRFGQVYTTTVDERVLYEPMRSFATPGVVARALGWTRRSHAAVLWLPMRRHFPIQMALTLGAHSSLAYVGNDVVAQALELWRQNRFLASVAELGTSRLALRRCKSAVYRGRPTGQSLEAMAPSAWEEAASLSTKVFADLHGEIARRPAPDGRTRLLFVGKPSARKGLPTLLDALKRLPPDEFSLTVVGDEGTDRKEGNVRFVPYLDSPRRLAEFYAMSDVLVVPSISPEGLPRVIDEARGFGCRVVASDLESHVHALVGDQSSGVFPAGDVAGLRATLLEVREDSTPVSLPSRTRQESAAQQHLRLLGYGSVGTAATTT